MFIKIDSSTFLNLNCVVKILIHDSSEIEINNKYNERIESGCVIVFVINNSHQSFGHLEKNREGIKENLPDRRYVHIPEYLVVEEVFKFREDAEIWIQKKLGVFLNEGRVECN